MGGISKEEIKKLFNKKKEQQMEFKHLDNKVKEYEEKIKSGIFSLTIQWENDISKIDLGKLKTPLIDDIKNNLVKDYEIVILNLDKVVSRHCLNPDKIYPKNNLWVKREPHTIARLIEFIENGNKIIPPLIQPTDKDNLSIIDGNHRIALCRFLKLTEVPFIIKKNYLQFADDLK